jgi:hypothetical protein
MIVYNASLLGTLGLAVTLLKWRTSSVLRSKGWVNIDGVLLLLLFFYYYFRCDCYFYCFQFLSRLQSLILIVCILRTGGLDDACLVCATLFFLKSIAPSSATRDEVVIYYYGISKRLKLRWHTNC